MRTFFFKFIYLWLCWVFVSVRGLSLVVASGDHSSLRCAGLSLSRTLLLRSTGSRRAGSVVAAHGPSCSAACGILPDQGLNPCPLHWQADSQPLRHQGSPWWELLRSTLVATFKYKIEYLGYFVCFLKFIYLFIYFWLRWVFIAVRGLSLVAASGGYSSLRCAGFSLRWLLLLWSTGFRCTGFSSCEWAQ